MLKNKITFYGAVLLIGIIVGQFFYYKHIKNNLALENLNLREEKKIELKRTRDSAFVRIKNITTKANKRFDSILNIPPTIKWKKYEKNIYIDRSLDDALRIHSRHKADTEARERDR